MTISGLLEHARYHFNLLIALALAASLAWWVAGKSDAATPIFEDIAAAEQTLSSSSKALYTELDRLNAWVEGNDPTPIKQNQ